MAQKKPTVRDYIFYAFVIGAVALSIVTSSRIDGVKEKQMAVNARMTMLERKIPDTVVVEVPINTLGLPMDPETWHVYHANDGKLYMWVGDEWLQVIGQKPNTLTP